MNAAPDAELAYDLAVACCGETFHVRRTLDLARRIEQAMGPIYPLAMKLRTMAVTIDELAMLVHTLLKEERDAPTIAQIREWVFASGPRVGPQLAADVLTLIAGNTAVAEHQRRRSMPDGARREEGTSPFARTVG